MPPTIQTTTAGGAAAPTVGAAPVEGMMAPPTIPVVPGAVFTPGAAAVTTMFTPSAPVTADAPPPVTEGAVSATPLTPVATANLAAPTGHQLAYQDLPANGFKRIETPSLASAGDSAALCVYLLLIRTHYTHAPHARTARTCLPVCIFITLLGTYCALHTAPLSLVTLCHALYTLCALLLLLLLAMYTRVSC